MHAEQKRRTYILQWLVTAPAMQTVAIVRGGGSHDDHRQYDFNEWQARKQKPLCLFYSDVLCDAAAVVVVARADG